MPQAFIPAKARHTAFFFPDTERVVQLGIGKSCNSAFRDKESPLPGLRKPDKGLAAACRPKTSETVFIQLRDDLLIAILQVDQLLLARIDGLSLAVVVKHGELTGFDGLFQG